MTLRNFTSLGLIIEIQMSPKLLFKDGFSCEHPENRYYNLFGQQASYRKKLRDHLDCGVSNCLEYFYFVSIKKNLIVNFQVTALVENVFF